MQRDRDDPKGRRIRRTLETSSYGLVHDVAIRTTGAPGGAGKRVRHVIIERQGRSLGHIVEFTKEAS